jgi:iron complex outermembrane recepter protein
MNDKMFLDNANDLQNRLKPALGRLHNKGGLMKTGLNCVAYATVLLATVAWPAVGMAAADGTRPAEVATDGGADAADEDATITVTGQHTALASFSATKTNTPLIETPQSITRIDNEELVRRNALSINQALGYVAGVVANQRGSVATRYDQLTIRGFAPGVFLDGMRLQGGSYSTPQIDFHRVESVDVIKGPASVLYGNSTPGGLVNVVSKTPKADPHGLIDLAAGNFRLFRGSVDVGGPIDAGKRVLYRFVGGGETSDGFIDTTRNRRWYVSPMLSFVPDAATSLTLIAAYQRDPKGGSYGSVPPFGSALPNPLGRLPVRFYDGEPSYEAFDRKQWSVTGMFRHDFGDVLRYRANLRYLGIKQHYRSVYGSLLQPDNRTLVRGGGGSDENFRTLTIDNNLAATFKTGPLSHELLGGLDFLEGHGVGYQRFVTGAAAGIPNLDIFAPVYGVTIPDVLAGATPTRTKRSQVGVYAQDQVHLGGLNLIGSIRHDWYQQNTLSGATLSRLKQDKTTYRAGILYAFDFGLSPYFSWSTSFEPQTGVNLAGQPFRPVTGRQFEAGLKYQPVGTQTILTLSVYDLARQNVVITDPVNPRNSIQVGETKTRGIELEGRGEVLPGLDVSLAGTYMDAKYSKGNAPVAGVVNAAVQSGVTGTRVLGQPKWSASSFLSYDLGRNRAVTGPLSGLTFGGGLRYVGASDGLYSIAPTGVTTLGRFKVDGFLLVDAMASYELGAMNDRLKGLSLALNASNLFQKRHVTSCFAANWCWFGAPRTVVGSLRYRW